MFLHLKHQELEVYHSSRKFVAECYALSRLFPPEEKFALGVQLRRASLSVYLNISEGCSRKSSSERKRFYEISRGSLIECDAVFDIAADLKYFEPEKAESLNYATVQCFKLITGLINS